MTTKELGDSVRHRLQNLSLKTGSTYQSLQTTFILERLVARLVSDELLSEHLVFKGGFVGLKIYASPRFTVDVDAIVSGMRIDSISGILPQIVEADLGDGVWFRFDRRDSLPMQNHYAGIRFSFRAGLGEVGSRLERISLVHLDIGVGDPVTAEPVEHEFVGLLPSKVDLSWKVYPIESIVAEKLHALYVFGDLNSRAKDLYDLAIFLPKTDPQILIAALIRCFAFRETVLPMSFTEVLRRLDTRALRRGWTSATASLREKPVFEEILDSILSSLTEVDVLLRESQR